MLACVRTQYPAKGSNLNSVSPTYPIVDDCLECVFHLLEKFVRLQDVDDPDKNQESLAFLVSGGDPTLHLDVGDVVLVKEAGLDALHRCGVGH